MKTLFATLCICLGVYFAAYSRRLITLRDGGMAPLFRLLEGVTGYLPYASIAILLGAGLVAAAKKETTWPQSFLAKLLLVLALALVPLAIHVPMYALTYSAGPATAAKMLGPLTVSEWLILLLGLALAAFGVSLLFRPRGA